MSEDFYEKREYALKDIRKMYVNQKTTRPIAVKIPDIAAMKERYGIIFHFNGWESFDHLPTANQTVWIISDEHGNVPKGYDWHFPEFVKVLRKRRMKH